MERRSLNDLIAEHNAMQPKEALGSDVPPGQRAVEVLVHGKYNDGDGKARRYEQGSTLVTHIWYAESLVEAGLAKWPEEDPDTAEEDEEPVSQEVDVTDSARALAEECGVDLMEMTGTGKDGRITLGDVRKVLSNNRG